MKHPVVPYDQALIDEISSAMDLRAPNKEALEAIAKSFDGSTGAPFEAVADLATAVGKTYLAAALIEYLSAQGVRHFLIVTPGRTILTKTRNNFTENHPKSVLSGMDVAPLVITEDNFNTGEVGAALDDAATTKVFVYTVQALVKPKNKARRRTRTLQENLGTDLYTYLTEVGDLVVISDEHHVYAQDAKAFSAAVRELDAMALIGLTATPNKSDLDKVVYHYPLARAIAERYVKTPVLVGRKDSRTDVETRLRDGMELLAAKAQATGEYSQLTGHAPVNPVMFVVCASIEDANEVAQVLRKPGFFPDDYDDRVLVIHSDAPDDNLARLDAVEDPASKVRVIVSVSMLKEGWDVKNIFVICSLRPSISDVLTEQTLGRGLRLPWGAYTGVELLDTVEVLSHERFEALLRKADVLLEGLVDQRAAKGGAGPVGITATPTDTTQPTPGGATPGDHSGAVVRVPESATSLVIAEAGVAAVIDDRTVEDPGAGQEVPAFTTVTIEAVEDRIEEAKAQAEQLTRTVAADHTQSVRIPRVSKSVSSRSFSLATVSDDQFIALGRKFATEGGTALERKVLEVVEDSNSPGGFRLVPREGSATIGAAAPTVPVGGIIPLLRDAILERTYITRDRPSVGAANRFAAAVVEGAGGEAKLASHVHSVANAVRLAMDNSYSAAPPVFTTTVTDEVFAPTRTNSRAVNSNRFGPFSRKDAYDGWVKSLHSLNWFDSEPERALANVLDADPDVALWSRIQRGEVTVRTDTGGLYSPDFYVRGTDSTHYLVEVKGDNTMGTEQVITKAKAAREWAQYVTDHGGFGKWRYLLVTESVLKTAKTFPAVIQQTSH